MYRITNNGSDYEAEFTIQAFDCEVAYAKYTQFNVGPEHDNYRLVIGGYSGTAGELVI